MQDTIKNIALIYGGGSSEHEISVLSANFLRDNLSNIDYLNIIPIELIRGHKFIQTSNQKPVEFLSTGHIMTDNFKLKIDAAIPCFHGYPGETGDIQSFLQILNIPFIGSSSEGHQICFNKLNTKLWFQNLNIPSVPFEYFTTFNSENLNRATELLKTWGSLFVKSTHQGSSVGCYYVSDEKELSKSIEEAHKLSPYVLLEKAINGRELEISVYQYKGEIFASDPGEIFCPTGFYDYNEKYSSNTKTYTETKAKNVPSDILESIKYFGKTAFEIIKLRHLARIDFLLSNQNELYLSEINTIPGLTKISLFPKMVEANGHSFRDFLLDAIRSVL